MNILFKIQHCFKSIYKKTEHGLDVPFLLQCKDVNYFFNITLLIWFDPLIT